jgi:hypothetical protein
MMEAVSTTPALETPEQSNRKTPEERKELLARTLSGQFAMGARVE